jgi:hypothetical protein
MMSNAISSTANTPAAACPEELARDISEIQKMIPRIGDKIASMWGSIGLNAYLSSLVFDERGGRQGFPEPIAAALFRLYMGHEALVHAKKSKDVWDVILDEGK